ncbi:hypothetical protein L596_004770 [Steinernema carpocapsae]|uniref:Prefoldin subunit 4 n=1 Tax=Steinernema carpocapsae TaxID=34508 RepID=A0A4U8V0E8_STECR|nr:hypothetical protein L596_004770 [Steinernema carpocapsae]
MATKKTVVTSADQAEINQFACLHMDTTEKKDELEKSASTLKSIGEAQDEMLLLDEEDMKSVPYKCGVIFIHCDEDNDEMGEMLEEDKDALESKVAELTEKISRNEKKMGDLKKVLYEKFGDNINLENNDD